MYNQSVDGLGRQEWTPWKNAQRSLEMDACIYRDFNAMHFVGYYREVMRCRVEVCTGAYGQRESSPLEV